MLVGKQASSSPRERTSLNSLTYDPITILLEMSQGLDAYHVAMRAAITSPARGHSQRPAYQQAAQWIKQEQRSILSPEGRQPARTGTIVGRDQSDFKDN